MSDPTLFRLKIEWQNRNAPDFNLKGRLVSMRDLERKLAELKKEYPGDEGYERIWQELAYGRVRRHAHNADFIVRLLYLVDERCVSAIHLQPSVNTQIGHLFRFLRRAGVHWKANTVNIGSRLRRGYWPWPGEIFLDPMNGTMIRHGRIQPIPEDLEIFRAAEDNEDPEGLEETERIRDDLLGLMDDEDAIVPLPLYARVSRKSRAKLPEYRRALQEPA